MIPVFPICINIVEKRDPFSAVPCRFLLFCGVFLDNGKKSCYSDRVKAVTEKFRFQKAQRGSGR